MGKQQTLQRVSDTAYAIGTLEGVQEMLIDFALDAGATKVQIRKAIVSGRSKAALDAKRSKQRAA